MHTYPAQKCTATIEPNKVATYSSSEGAKYGEHCSAGTIYDYASKHKSSASPKHSSSRQFVFNKSQVEDAEIADNRFDAYSMKSDNPPMYQSCFYFNPGNCEVESTNPNVESKVFMSSVNQDNFYQQTSPQLEAKQYHTLPRKQDHFERSQDEKSLVVDYHHISDYGKQDRYEARNKEYVNESRGYKNQHPPSYKSSLNFVPIQGNANVHSKQEKERINQYFKLSESDQGRHHLSEHKPGGDLHRLAEKAPNKLYEQFGSMQFDAYTTNDSLDVCNVPKRGYQSSSPIYRPELQRHSLRAYHSSSPVFHAAEGACNWDNPVFFHDDDNTGGGYYC